MLPRLPTPLFGMMTTGCGASGGGAPNSAEAQQFFDRLLTPPVAVREALYVSFIDDLVAAGVWAKLDALYLYTAADEATGLTNLIQTAYQGARHPIFGSVTFTANAGFSSSGGNVTSNFNPSTASGAHFTRNDACVFAWSYTTTQINGPFVIDLDGAGATIGNVAIFPKWSDGKAYSRCNAGADMGPTNSGNSSGLFLVQRTASNAQAVYRNDSLLGSDSAASTALANGDLCVRCNHNARIFGIGASLTAGERTALYNALVTYITAVTGGVP